MKNKRKNTLKKTGAALFTAACLFSLFLPLPKRTAGGEVYECVWADGSVTSESFSSAYQNLVGIDGESVLLSRGGVTGKIESRAKELYDTLENGNFAELLGCFQTGSRIDGAALFRTFRERVWYGDGYYVWTGNKIERVAHAHGSEIVFLQGGVSSRVLKETGAETAYLRAEAEVKTDSFAESKVEKVYAEAPYSAAGGAIYLDTAGGKRLVSALATPEVLTLDSDTEFADEGALGSCQGLASLTLPFCGSAKSPYGSAYRGELAHLFSLGGVYRVPETLRSVTVTGGRLVSFAFYGCRNLEEIDVCKVAREEISRTAFTGLASLKYLHTPKSDVSLTGNFHSYTADCGCTIFERI